jgi:hypothetical protein
MSGFEGKNNSLFGVSINKRWLLCLIKNSVLNKKQAFLNINIALIFEVYPLLRQVKQ